MLAFFAQVTWQSFESVAIGWLDVVGLIGTFVFALEGAMAAIKGNLDFFGIMVLAFVTALGGGIIRDLLIGAVPPNSIRDWRYPVVAFIGAATAFFFSQLVQEIPSPLMIGLAAAAPQRFARWLQDRLFGRVPFAAVHPIVPDTLTRTSRKPSPTMTGSATALTRAAIPCSTIRRGSESASDATLVSTWVSVIWVMCMHLAAQFLIQIGSRAVADGRSRL